MYRLFILTCVFLQVCQTAYSKEWLFRAVDSKNGLADNYVRDISTDSDGYIWLSTINGLSRYDGYHFLNFKPQEWGAWSGDVTMVRETADGTLWALCPNQLFTYHRDSLTWRADGMQRLSQLGVHGKKISKFYVDENGHLWVVTEQGLYHYNYRDELLSRIDCRNIEPILHIVVKNGAALIVTTSYKIYKVGNDYNRLTYLTQHPQLEIESRDSRALMDSKMNLWLYHSYEPIGSLWRYSLSNGQWQQSQFLTNLESGVTINAMTEDHKGHLWIGTGNQGLFVLSGDGTVIRANAFSHANSHITCLFVDSNNTLWAGSAKLGSAYADLNSQEFTHVSTHGVEDVSTLMEDRQGNLWIGFDGGGILKGTTTFTAKHGQLPSDNITVLTTDIQGRIIAGSYGGGISRFDGQRFVRLYTDYDCLRYVKAIVSDRHGSLWVGTVDKGVVRITADQHFSTFTASNSPIRSDGILSLAYDAKNDRVYIGSSVGVSAYDCQRGTFCHDKLLDSLKNINATTLSVDHEGRLWIGSRNGLWVKHQSLTHLTTEQGLTNQVVRAIAVSNHTAWVSTDNGLTCITQHRGKYYCRPFFDSDGLHGIIFANNAALTTHSGHILLGSLTGYISIPAHQSEQFHPLSESPSRLHVEFTEFQLDGHPVSKLLNDGTINYGERLAISISIMVPALSHKVRYYYRFKGEDQWMRAPSNMLYFNSLMPGRHVLQVKAELPGMATTQISELAFSVRPPLWLSTPLILCYLLIIGFIIYLCRRAIHFRQKRQLAMKQISFFTNISHDIKTPLTLVMAPLEKMRQANLPAAVRTELDVAWQNAHELYDLVLELLDFRRLDEGKEELKISQGELVGFVRQTVHSFEYYAARKHVNIEMLLPDAPIEIAFDENKMRRIITNLLSNACKYNIEGGRVLIRLSHDAQQLTLSIADTGIGIKNKRQIFNRFVQETHGQEQEGSGLGLHIVHQYVEMMGGSITATDNKPTGTIFTITLPYPAPAAAAVAATPAVAASPAVASATKPLTILVVEDNSDARLFLQRSLQDEYHVLVAANGKEAMHLLAKDDNVHLIISDVMMPVMDGIDLVRHLHKNIKFSHIPIILLTAKSSEADIITGLEEGVADYLTKPFSLTVLKLRVKKILEWTQHIHSQVANGIEIKPSEITVSSIDEELINRVIAEIEANISDSNYSVVQLSGALGMTRGTLYKKLMAIVGKSPVEFMRIIRLKRGKSLLDQGRTNISEVADQVGFSSKIFAQYFRETYGCSPSEYLKRDINVEEKETGG